MIAKERITSFDDDAATVDIVYETGDLSVQSFEIRMSKRVQFGAVGRQGLAREVVVYKNTDILLPAGVRGIVTKEDGDTFISWPITLELRYRG